MLPARHDDDDDDFFFETDFYRCECFGHFDIC